MFRVYDYLGVEILVAFTPKGGCPLKLNAVAGRYLQLLEMVAFTPKGGCPLKPVSRGVSVSGTIRSIHPQGWVPIETAGEVFFAKHLAPVAFTPKGGCPLKRRGRCSLRSTSPQ